MFCLEGHEGVFMRVTSLKKPTAEIIRDLGVDPDNNLLAVEIKTGTLMVVRTEHRPATDWTVLKQRGVLELMPSGEKEKEGE
jgi:hypothetical protein